LRISVSRMEGSKRVLLLSSVVCCLLLLHRPDGARSGSTTLRLRDKEMLVPLAPTAVPELHMSTVKDLKDGVMSDIVGVSWNATIVPSRPCHTSGESAMRALSSKVNYQASSPVVPSSSRQAMHFSGSLIRLSTDN
jgi:hypothetical protein